MLRRGLRQGPAGQAARRRRKTYRKIIETVAPEAVDLSAVWVGELADSNNCNERLGLVKRIRDNRITDALPVLEEIRSRGTGLFSGAFCMRNVLGPTIEELGGE